MFVILEFQSLEWSIQFSIPRTVIIFVLYKMLFMALLS